MLLPVSTGSGEAILPIAMTVSAASTVVVAVALSLPFEGSAVSEVTVAVLEITVPAGTEVFNRTVRVKAALPGGREAIEQETVPPAPCAGAVQLQPAGEERNRKVLPAGRVSLQETLAAWLGPALSTV